MCTQEQEKRIEMLYQDLRSLQEFKARFEDADARVRQLLKENDILKRQVYEVESRFNAVGNEKNTIIREIDIWKNKSIDFENRVLSMQGEMKNLLCDNERLN